MNRILFGVFLIGIVNIQCGGKKEKINLSAVEINTELKRFDEAIFESETFTNSELEQLKERFPDFYPIFASQVIRPLKGEEIEAINGFKNYFDSLKVYQYAQQQFGNFEKEFAQIETLQKRFKYYFPSYQELDVTTLISAFVFKNALTNNTIAISLDTYLDSVDYSLMGEYIPLYQLHGFDKKYLLADVGTALIDDFYPDSETYTTLLDRCVFEGKKLFLKEKLLPNAQPHILLGMTKEDYQWCKDNEADIWKFFLSEELLFSRDYNKFKSYVTEGPFSSGMPEGAPARTGNFIGWQIVKRFESKNKSVSVKDIILNQNSQAILNGAKYDP